MLETWKDIKNYENCYQISNLGNVKSLISNKILKQTKTKNNYLTVQFNKNKKVKKYYIHRLVAETFIENIYNKPCVNHIDGNKQNNITTNLEWVSYSENEKHAYKNGFKTPTKALLGKRRDEKTKQKISEKQKGKINKGCKKRMRAINQHGLDNKYIRTFESSYEAIRFLKHGNPNSITRVCRNIRPTAYGYIWRYVNE